MDRLHAVLRGALHVWRVEGQVTASPAACVIRVENRVVTVRRVSDDGPAPYWEVALEGEAGPPPEPCAGMQGMLRAVRDLLDPTGAAGRLVVGRMS